MRNGQLTPSLLPVLTRSAPSTNPSPQFPAEDITVWIDPLDATKEYTEKLTEYVTVMACVAVNGVPVAGVIRKPFDDKTYWAWVSV